MPITRLRKKVLVTGGSGYIGSVLVPTLLQKGFFVRVLDIAPFTAPIPRQYKKYFEYVQKDIRRIESPLVTDIFAIIHLAAFSDEPAANKNLVETKEVNTNATFHIAKMAKKIGVARFVFASSASLYDFGIGNKKGPQVETAAIAPKGAYSKSKYQAEKKLLTLADEKFTIVILRKATVCGFSPTMRFDLVVNAMVKSAVFHNYIKVFCRGLQWRPLISINDASEAYYKGLTVHKALARNQIFNIAYDNFLVKDIASLVQKTLEKHFSIHTKVIFEQDDRRDRSYQMEKDKAQDVLDFKAKTTIEDTIIDLAGRLRKKGI